MYNVPLMKFSKILLNYNNTIKEENINLFWLMWNKNILWSYHIKLIGKLISLSISSKKCWKIFNLILYSYM